MSQEDGLLYNEKSEVLSFQSSATSEEIDVKKIFLKFDSSAPISNEILNSARFLCAEYLSGSWTKVQAENFKIREITGGLSNLLFCVELSPRLDHSKHEPEKALLRIHCQPNRDQLLIESVVFTLLSERNLGPKILGVFPGGRFEQFIPSRPLQIPEIRQPHFICHIAPIFAKLHTLDVPISKSPQALNSMRGWLGRYKKTEAGKKPIKICLTQVELPETDYPTSVTVEELEEEINFIEHYLLNSDSPVVFTHNDLHAGNILLTDGFTIAEDGKVTDKFGEKTDEEPLLSIDFEFCSYNHRGFDLGNHFCEYGLEFLFPNPPYYKINKDWMELDKERDIFCEAYLHKLYKMQSSGDNSTFPSNLTSGDYDKDFAQLKRESILFMPVVNMFWSCWGLNNEEEGVLPFDFTNATRDRLALYFHQKKNIEQYLKSL